MPVSIERLLVERASAVRPTATQLAGAQRSHLHLRELLVSGQMADRITRIYLTGSYERDTAVYPLDDVDMIFEIDPTKWPGTSTTSPPSPLAVLQTFARALRRRYEKARARLQGRSVGLTLSHIHVDLVPAIAHTHDGLLWIPDRHAKTWMVSAPAVHRELATNANKRCAGLFKPHVRLLKAWNRGLPSTARLKSFAVETIALVLAQHHPFDSLADSTRRFFDFVAWLGDKDSELGWKDAYGVSFGGWFTKPTLKDSAGTGHNVLAKCDRERALAFASRAATAREKLKRASAARDNESADRYLDALF
jgi:hypothetical protein